MTQQRIIVLMGSKSDLPFAHQIGDFLAKEGFSIKPEYNVASAHKTPSLLLNKMKSYEETKDAIVYITVAGLSDALSGIAAGSTKRPVIACPPDVGKLGWAKAFSSVMTPKGVSVLFAPSPENAALAAMKILALADSSLGNEVKAYMRKKREEVIQADKEVTG